LRHVEVQLQKKWITRTCHYAVLKLAQKSHMFIRVYTGIKKQQNVNKAQIPIGPSRHDTTRHDTTH